ncbi:MAG: nitrogen fixation protein NifM [Hydrogenophilales bacterium 28-61-23]|nr:MAG: nitrogen fixation protein NifM [Hydrogenophilales bacterium 28-61-23]
MPEPAALAALAYLELKTAQSLFGKSPAELAEDERAKVRNLADRQMGLEARVLNAPEARDAMVPQVSLQAALEEIRKRYPEEAEFSADLERNGLDTESFLAALERELRVEAILEKVGTRATQVAEIDVDLYYHYHPDQFRRPETRRARHILVTVNPDMPDNTVEAARTRIEAVAARLAKSLKRFDEQALKHSECPTAMQGGVLGDVPRGQLYPELDAALFGMQAGQLSGVLESPLGFHLLLCEAITPERVLSLNQARAPIRDMLEQRRKRICQQAWLKQLQMGQLPAGQPQTA